ncbi:retinol dehydrogenase 14-like [Onthophagus taurus]|uniref:retinol dehydrogenase 14-like n=1 Tax=Onthophagus taurus TaxID=166361 RepID=UPI0039BE6C7C
MNCFMFYTISFIITIIFITVVLKLYFKLRIKPLKTYTCLIGKTVIITGANTGIGYVTAIDLAQRGAKVILGCRNEEKAQEAVKNIIKQTKNENVSYKILDLKSFQSVREFAKEINKNEDKIDILINNAGVGGVGNKLTEDGNQMTLQVNYLSHFLLTHLLIDKLKNGDKSRIINVSSVMARYANINVKNLNEYSANLHPVLGRLRLYANSKLCQIYFTIILAEKLKGTGICVNVLHPGSVQTNIFRKIPYEIFVNIISRIFFKTPEEGARTSIFLATSKLIDYISGKLFDNCSQIEFYKSARDKILGAEIWNKSEELVSLEQDEKIF